eukprot:TRINITY_DN6106_c0_g1_i1.p1 TRINITY_DN6106_c0_g1~~TRINITY_DN6106_c0_g1_i1.p1  ORF type:complete len:308 (-),score=34.13 TRINITY_DN6106_c0_g1_i1:636-1484(-)
MNEGSKLLLARYHLNAEQLKLAKELEDYLKAGGIKGDERLGKLLGNGYKCQEALGCDAFRRPFQNIPAHFDSFPTLCHRLENFARSRAEYHSGGPSSAEVILSLIPGVTKLLESPSTTETLQARRLAQGIYTVTSQVVSNNPKSTLYLGTAAPHKKALVATTRIQEWRWDLKTCYLLHIESGAVLGVEGGIKDAEAGSKVILTRQSESALQVEFPWKAGSGQISCTDYNPKLVLDVDGAQKGIAQDETLIILWEVKGKLRKSPNQIWHINRSKENWDETIKM